MGPRASLSAPSTAPCAPATPRRAPTQPPLPEWLHGLDGLRAIAVLAVLLFHADLGTVTGGFLGVDVFFVISGFLITTLLLREHAATERLDLVGFWRRRARRLLPALFFVLMGVVAFAAIAVPDALMRLRGDVLAALGYVTNWYLIADHQSYFERIGRPSLLRHLWSLAVEEQFYLVWPIVLAVALAVVRRRGALLVAVGLVAVSVAWTVALFDPETDPSRVYYGTDTRLFALLVGAVLAFAWTVGPTPLEDPVEAAQPRLHWADVLAVAGLAVLLWAFLAVDQFEPLLYPWGSLGIAVVAAGVIAGAAHPAGFLGSRVLDVAPLRWIGRRSYAIYLWHWPIFVLTRPGLDLPLTPIVDLALRLMVTFALAEASHRFIETPVRRGALGAVVRHARAALRGSAWVRAGTLASAAAVVVVIVAVSGRVIAAPAAPAVNFVPAASFQGVVAADNPPPTDIAVVPPASPMLASVGPGTKAASVDASQSVVPTPDKPEPAGTASVPPLPANPDVAPPIANPGRAPTVAPDWSTLPPVEPSAAASVGPAASTIDSPAPSAPPAPPPTPTPAAPSPRPAAARVLAIGDSVLLGAVQELGRALGRVEVDAQIGRQMSTALAILDERRQSGRLADVVIVHLGNNGPVTARQVTALFDLLADVPHVIVLTVRIPDPFEAHNNRMFTEMARDRANVILVDWHAASAGRTGLFWNDGEHLRPEGAQFYASLVAAAFRDNGLPTR